MLISALELQVSWVTLMVMLLIIGVIPQNRVTDTITHTTLNTINNVVKMDKAYPYMGGTYFVGRGRWWIGERYVCIQGFPKLL
jgi:hypothetical protein